MPLKIPSQELGNERNSSIGKQRTAQGVGLTGKPLLRPSGQAEETGCPGLAEPAASWAMLCSASWERGGCQPSFVCFEMYSLKGGAAAELRATDHHPTAASHWFPVSQCASLSPTMLMRTIGAMMPVFVSDRHL